jgi:hypothetical protein
MKRYSWIFAVVLMFLAAGWIHALNIGGTSVFIPVVIHSPGAQSTQWRTDLWISNSSNVEKDITVTYYPNGGTPSSFTTHIGMWATIEIDDVVLSQFGDDNSKGLLLLTTEGTSGFSARARIYNTGNPAGEFGQFVPGFPVGICNSGMFIPGLSGINGNRSNIGIANLNDEAVHCAVNVYDGDGNHLGGAPIEVPANSLVQANDIFTAWNIAPQGNVQIRISTTGNVPIYAYASVVSGGTGDAIYIFGTSPNS